MNLPPNTHPLDHHEYMGMCITLAQQAADVGEVPVGSIVVYRPDELHAYVIGQGFNLRESTQDPTAHAEMIALRQASQFLGSWRLIDCDLYVTLEPCLMCAGTLVNARIERVIYGCNDYKSGACDSLYQIPSDTRLNHRYQVVPQVRAEECKALLQTFFRARRLQNKRRK